MCGLWLWWCEGGGVRGGAGGGRGRCTHKINFVRIVSCNSPRDPETLPQEGANL